ncbi:ExeM/NucH family extracellular endonuclease [Tamilnaduibacter salinus]|nr:ExeM/NucH family extracellular endonuclease [Tamilnaduibacter salinus]
MANRTSLLLLLLFPSVVAGQCGDPATPISAVQGDDWTSPMAGDTVTVEGIVTLDARGKTGLGGFYLQSGESGADDDPATSKAVFVYTRDSQSGTGRRARVTGVVKEYEGLTELSPVHDVTDCGPATLPAPESLMTAWPLSGRNAERLEGMRVGSDSPLTVIDTYQLARFGTVTLALAPQYQPTRTRSPGPAALELKTRQSKHRLLLDDARAVQNPVMVHPPEAGLSADRTLRAGMRLGIESAVLDYRYDEWRLQPMQPPRALAGNERPKPPGPTEPGVYRLVSFNLGNLFNGDGQGSGFPTERGADTAREWQRQRAKLVAAIDRLDADLLVLSEVENDGAGRHAALAELVRLLDGDWRWVLPGQGGPGTDAIRVALAYRADRIRTVGEPETVTGGPFDALSRVPLIQRFRPVDGGQLFRVAANHFKSRRCQGATGTNRAAGDGQGCYSAARMASAKQLASALSSSDRAVPTVIGGDLNSYVREDPIRTLQAAGYGVPVNPPPPTYRYRGRAGTLDYLMIDQAGHSRVDDYGVWAINANEPRALDYNLEYHPKGRAERLFEPGPWRSSDHDPVYLDLRLRH